MSEGVTYELEVTAIVLIKDSVRRDSNVTLYIIHENGEDDVPL